MNVKKKGVVQKQGDTVGSRVIVDGRNNGNEDESVIVEVFLGVHKLRQTAKKRSESQSDHRTHLQVLPAPISVSLILLSLSVRIENRRTSKTSRIFLVLSQGLKISRCQFSQKIFPISGSCKIFFITSTIRLTSKRTSMPTSLTARLV